MQRKILLGGLAALSVLGTGGFALAQQPSARPMADVSRADFVARRIERLTAADANRDGQITVEERGANRQAKRAERVASAFDRLDANRDGVLSREEFETRRMRAGRAGRAQQVQRMGRRMAERGPVPIADVQARAEQAFDRLDSNRDGVLTVDERRAGRQQMREVRRERRMERRQTSWGASPRAPGAE